MRKLASIQNIKAVTPIEGLTGLSLYMCLAGNALRKKVNLKQEMIAYILKSTLSCQFDRSLNSSVRPATKTTNFLEKVSG